MHAIFIDFQLLFSSGHLFLCYTFFSCSPFLPFSCNFICFFMGGFDGPNQLKWDVESSMNFPEVLLFFTVSIVKTLRVPGDGTTASRLHRI